MKSNDNRTIVTILTIVAASSFSVSKAQVSETVADTPRVIIGTSVNPLLIITSGGTYSSAPTFSLQAKLPGQRITSRIAFEYQPGDNHHYLFGRGRYLSQTDSTVTYLNEHTQVANYRLAVGGEYTVRRGRFSAYIGADAYVQLNHFHFDTWKTVTLGDSALSNGLDDVNNTSDLTIGGGIRPFFGLSSDLSQRLTVSGEIAPSLLWTPYFHYEANEDLAIARNSSTLFSFDMTPMVNVRLHYSFY